MKTAKILKKSEVTTNGNIILTVSVASTQKIFGKDVPVNKKYCLALKEEFVSDLAIDAEFPIEMEEFRISEKSSDEGTCMWLFPKG